MLGPGWPQRYVLGREAEHCDLCCIKGHVGPRVATEIRAGTGGRTLRFVLYKGSCWAQGGHRDTCWDGRQNTEICVV